MQLKTPQKTECFYLAMKCRRSQKTHKCARKRCWSNSSNAVPGLKMIDRKLGKATG